jgi:hypothetical protein
MIDDEIAARVTAHPQPFAGLQPSAYGCGIGWICNQTGRHGRILACTGDFPDAAEAAAEPQIGPAAPFAPEAPSEAAYWPKSRR